MGTSNATGLADEESGRKALAAGDKFESDTLRSSPLLPGGPGQPLLYLSYPFYISPSTSIILQH